MGTTGRRDRPPEGKAVARLDVFDWPGGVEPVWTMLDAESVEALGADPLEEGSAVRLADDLSETELAGSAFVRNALVLLGEADGWGTLWTGTNGNLMVKDVARLRALMSWPGLEETERLRAGKTHREQAVGELHLLRRVVEKAGLLDASALSFDLTPAGRAMLEPGARGALQALLFREAFWHMDLSRHVAGRPRGLPGWWPQGDVGIVLWSLSQVGDEWRNARTLATLCAVPDENVAPAGWPLAGTMFARHILDPLRWFGLVECDLTELPHELPWRKTALFDRFLWFDVRLVDHGTAAH